jgi:hypothetical protein
VKDEPLVASWTAASNRFALSTSISKILVGGHSSRRINSADIRRFGIKGDQLFNPFSSVELEMLSADGGKTGGHP